MRELTMAEIEVVSGGTGDQNPNIAPGEMITVTGSRIFGNFFLSTGPSFGGAPDLAGLANFSIASLSPDLQALINQAMAEAKAADSSTQAKDPAELQVKVTPVGPKVDLGDWGSIQAAIIKSPEGRYGGGTVTFFIP